MATPRVPPGRVAAMRRFNRFYTRQIGILSTAHLGSPYSLTEVRVLYELAHRRHAIASDLVSKLGLDPGYTSRLLARFEKAGLVARTRAKNDARRAELRLTLKGRAEFAGLDRKANDQVRALLAPLEAARQDRLLAGMQSIEQVLQAGAEDSYSIRPHRPGDMGWITHRHGVLYDQEYGWDMTFEALVGEITSAFITNFDAKQERCWIAERGRQIVGSIFCVKASATVAKLRLLYVEPSARGLGIGKHLVRECVAFATDAGYRKMILWTNNNLDAARHIYIAEGFKLKKEEAHHSFGHDLVGQNWERPL